MPRKEGAPEIPVEMDGVIWQVMWDTRLKGGNLSATARALEKLFRTTTQFEMSNDVSAEFNKALHAISTAGMADPPKFALLSPEAEQYEAAWGPETPRVWGWRSILETTPAGRRLRRFMAP